MSELCKKYNISEQSLKMMVKDGVISTTWPFYDEVVIFYKQKQHLGKPEAVKQAAEKYGVTEKTIYQIIKRI